MVSEEQNSEMELASEVIPVPQVLPETQNVNNEEIDGVNNEIVNNDEDASQRGKNPRHRKKAIYAAILKQMEFYFGDSNLTKDRFLAGLIKENPDVDIEVFLQFNRMKSLTTDVTLIRKALRESTMLEVSEDGTKVRRVTPIVPKQNIDECTVYIQGLPSDADHDWLTKLFSEYGPVEYVSIPKFRYNNKIKGFAFIEFKTPEAAEKCLKAFRAKGCELPCQTSPTDVLSITTFNEEENQEKIVAGIPKKSRENKNKRLKEDDEPSESGEPKMKKMKKNKSSKSNDLRESETDESEYPKSKAKQENIDGTNEEKQAEIITESEANRENNEEKLKSKKRKKKFMDHKDSAEEQSENSHSKTKIIKVESSLDSSSCVSDTNVEGDEKRGKKRKNRPSSEGTQEVEIESQNTHKKKKSKSEETSSEQEHAENEVDAKKENNEKSIDGENTENVEKKKKKKRKRNNHNHEVIKAANLGLQVMGKKSWKKLRNKYLELQRAKMKQLKQHMRNARWNQWGEKNKMECEIEENAINKKDNPASNLEFTPGVIVKVELNQACIDPKGFKAELKNHCDKIKYVDIKEGSNIAFVRCESAEAAKKLSEETNDDRCFKILEDGEEKSYWDKIAMDRKEKIDKKIRPKHRGRDKLLKKAEKELGKHIKFDEDLNDF